MGAGRGTEATESHNWRAVRRDRAPSLWSSQSGLMAFAASPKTVVGWASVVAITSSTPLMRYWA
jgi:hypothetical protein